ncbi:hypothetical protein GALL_171700 [mine drainage metagenome]|uniref:Uncharacterized protein n=1 Tax=mine drainage metagenome TaxID=410659 RepID=A0A1J5RXG6_9ZZZZ
MRIFTLRAQGKRHGRDHPPEGGALSAAMAGSPQEEAAFYDSTYGLLLLADKTPPTGPESGQKKD